MADHLLLGFESREILAEWLRSKDRPNRIDPIRWRRFRDAALASIRFDEMATLIDNFGPEILDLLMWPRLRLERRVRAGAG